MTMVSVLMITYNHENFIREAIESILMQKTDFAIELIIGEDCSTDNTREIVVEYANKYPKIVKVQLPKKNRGMHNNFTAISVAAIGKYIALCEGDDYWTDPYKLQKQVDFLEVNPDYGLVYTNYQKLNENSGVIYNINCDSQIVNGEIYDKYLVSSFIGTCTVMAKRKLVIEFLDKYHNEMSRWAMGDRPLWLFISSLSKCGFISEYTSVYRRNENSVSSFKDIHEKVNFLAKSYEVRQYFIDHVRSVSEVVKNQVNDSYHRQLLEYYSEAKFEIEAKKHYSLILKPRPSDYANLLKSKNDILANILAFGIRKLYSVLNRTKILK